MITTFKNSEVEEKHDFSVKPIINISKIVLDTKDNNWVNRLYAANFKINIEAFDAKNVFLGKIEEHLSFAQLISPNHLEPVFQLNQIYQWPDSMSNRDLVKYTYTITLINFIFLENEKMEIHFMTSEHVKNRVEDWSNRVNSFIDGIIKWNIQDVEVKESKSIPMSEGLMKQFEIPKKEIRSANIFLNDKLKLAIRPYGLWIMGANGRIDLIKSDGAFIVVDTAEQFASPKWKLTPSTERAVSVDFNEELLTQILKS